MTDEGGTALLAAVGVRKRFGALVVLDSVDVTVGAGEALGIVGPNGAGKTTLLNVFAGSQRPDAAEIRFHGTDATSAGAAARCRIRGPSFRVPSTLVRPSFRAPSSRVPSGTVIAAPKRRRQCRSLSEPRPKRL